jgi:hypothetical protein
VRPRRQTIPVIPASVTRTLQGGPRPAAATTPPVAKPATSPAITRASPPALPRKAESKPAPVGLSSQANEETQSGAAAHEETTTSDPTQEETTTSEPALGAAPERDPEPTQASAQSEAGASDGEPDDVTFAGSIDADAASEPTVEPTQTKRPDTSVTAVELDADMLDEDDEDVTRLRPPKHDDDELPSIDLDGMLAGIGDGPDLAARGNTVIARGDTVIARADALPRATALPRVHTLKAAALPVEGYPDDANELSLSDGEVLVDRTLVTPARPPPPPLGLTSTMPTPKTPAPPLEDAPSGGSGKLLVAGVIGALALGVLVAVIVSGRNDTDTTARTDTASTEIADAAKSGAQPDEAKSAATPLADAKGEPQSDPPANPDNDAPAEPVVKADPAAKPSPSEAVRDPSGTRPALATATVKPAAKLPTTARAPAVLPPPKTKVQAALRAREVRALDILLVARKPTRPLAFADATRHCSALDVRGIQGWRLPDVGELASLGSAGMLARGVYWSQTSGDTFGDTHMAWNGRTGQAASRIKGAVALCVRGDRGEAQ